MNRSNSHRAGLNALKSQSNKIVDDVKELGTITANSLGHSANRLKSRGSDALSNGRKRLGKLSDGAQRFLAEHPVKSLLVAIGIGALMGLAVRRRRPTREPS